MSASSQTAPGPTAASTDAALRRVTRRLAERYAPEAVVLYGSQAWGRPHPRHSDADLFVLKGNPAEDDASRAERARTVRELLREAPRPAETLPLDVLVLTPQEAEYRLARGDRFVSRILTEGRVLHERAGAAASSLQRLRKKVDAMPPPDESDYPHEWIERADKDWRRVQVLLGADDSEMAAFRLQQAVEKFLKVFLLSKGWTLRKTHRLTDLLAAAAAEHDVPLDGDAAPADFDAVCSTITDFYFADRYPALPGEERPQTDSSAAGVRSARTQVEPLVDALRKGVGGT